MREKAFNGEVGIARQRCLLDRFVLGIAITLVKGRMVRQDPIADILVVELVAEPEQDRRSAG